MTSKLSVWLFAVALLLCACLPSQAQNVRFDVDFTSVSAQYTPLVQANVPPNSPILAVCNHPANATPCTNYATTYTSAGAACPNGSQDTPQPQPSACQSTGDAQGNIGFWIPAGTYDYTVCIANTVSCFGPITITLASPGSAGVNPNFMFGAGNFSFTGLTPVASGAVQDDQALRVYAIQFCTPYTLSFSRLSFSAANNVLGGGLINIGAYSAAGTLIYQTGAITVPNASVTDLDETLSSTWTLAPGCYYEAWAMADNSNTTVWGWGMATFAYTSGTSDRNLINRNSTVNYGYGANAATSGVASLPSTLGTLTAITSSNPAGNPAFLFQK
jgi:hypothetical protein